MSPKVKTKHKDAYIKTRIEPELKFQAERVIKALGLTTTQAVALFYRQILLNKGLPFDVKIPNKETLEVFERTDKGEDLTEYNSVDEFFEEMGI
ncbi:MAG: type II toxin-antitoxin system RelB/DinJ family antitoxin [Candidatus Margulisbacteria bacterium]|nr:type II toxin-antitoxin system RelB/DinJ family antitoxin [Candidatus Margulisiibacteriota bacterium]